MNFPADILNDFAEFLREGIFYTKLYRTTAQKSDTLQLLML